MAGELSIKELLDQIFAITTNLSAEDIAKFKAHAYKFVDHPVFEPVSKFVKALSKDVKDFMECVSHCGPNAHTMLSTNIPRNLMTLSPANPTMLRIYENIVVDTYDHNLIQECDPLSLDSVLGTMCKEYDADEYRDKKWADVNKRISAFIDMPTARALTRHANFKNYKDDQINSLAVKIDDYRKPLEIKYAETPEEFHYMYASGPTSCMGHSSGNSASWKPLTENKLYPPSFYAWYPHTKGAYIDKGGKVLARVICFERPDGKWEYGRIYAATTEYHQKFVKTLVSNGITQMPNRHRPPNNVAFTLPSFPIKGSDIRVAPWPYFDDMDATLATEYDETTKEFKVYNHISKQKALCPPNDPKGIIRSVDYAGGAMCDYCGKKGKIIVSFDNMKAFCSYPCGAKMGYIQVHQGNGVIRWEQPNEYHIFTVDGTLAFTTLRAARDNGYLPVLKEGVIPEDGEYVVHNIGTVFHDADGREYRDIHNEYSIVTDMLPIEDIHYQTNVQFDEDKLYVEEVVGYAA